MSRKNTNEEEEEVSSGVDEEDEVGKRSDEEVDNEDGDNEESDQEIDGKKTGRGRRMELRNRKSRSQEEDEEMDEGMEEEEGRMEENEVEKGEEKKKSFNLFDSSLFSNGLIPNLSKSFPSLGVNQTGIPFPSFPPMVPTLPKEVAIMPRNSTSFGLVALVHLSKGKQLGPYEAKVHKERSDGRWKVSFTLLPYLFYITVPFLYYGTFFILRYFSPYHYCILLHTFRTFYCIHFYCN